MTTDFAKGYLIGYYQHSDNPRAIGSGEHEAGVQQGRDDALAFRRAHAPYQTPLQFNVSRLASAAGQSRRIEAEAILR